jgi:outer membrane protein assembly factor BamA
MLKEARLDMADQKGLLNQGTVTLGVGGVRDTRNFIHYPTSGSEWKYGAMVYLQTMKGPIRNALELESRYRKFHSISSRSSLACMVLARYRMGEITYPLMRQMGYGMDYVRGFESQVMDGNGLILSKLAFRYALLPNNTKMNLGILPKAYEKIPIQAWFNIFADVGRVLQPYQRNLNPLGNQTLGSVGFGCDALIYYDALVRTDLSFNPNFKRWVFNLTFYHAL